MLKHRVIPTLLHKQHGLVKGVGFDSWRRTGSALQAIRVYQMRQVDELVLLDIAATPEQRGPDLMMVDDLADECFMPLTVGGGVRSIDDIRDLLLVGADKVAVNSAFYEDPRVIEQGAQRFGSQCMVFSLDVMYVAGTWDVRSHCGTRHQDDDPVRVAQRAESCGAGEILLTSIDRDGTFSGYDTELIAAICASVRIPVIASGGAGTYDHMIEALAGGASAVAAASIYHFTEQTPLEAKRRIAAAGYPVRLVNQGA